MRIPIPVNRCESDGVTPLPVNATMPVVATGRLMAELRMVWLTLLLASSVFAVGAEATNASTNSNGPTNNSTPSRAESAPQKLDEAAFRIIAERNIFNAERIGAVRIASSRRPARVESFKLVGTMAYAKGAFAFFEGSSSELTKVVPADGVIAGHKLVDILTDGVKLEADGKILEVSIGSAMRREDEGAWRLGEAVAGSASSSFVSSRENGDSSRSSRSGRSDRENDSSRSRRGESDSESERPATATTTTSPASTSDPAEILKRLMERREKESQ